MLSANEIRQQFLDFFREKDHTIVPSASLVPHNDPTLIFTNAGMNQFKDVFLGTGTRSYVRAADTQKCIRVSGKHNDLDEVGRDTYHHTFFEMLGNWSFGDYYKKEAIIWAWELLTSRWGLEKSKLYATVHHTDDEAEQLWKTYTDINPEHVMRFGDKDNFWEMGDTGPCGPCSEIHIDLGPERCDKSHIPGHVCSVNGGCARYIELWNLVFIQYNRKADGSLEELPNKHVDTGMGFERIVSVLQGKRSNYDIDLFATLIKGIETVSNKSYQDSENQVAIRVIADHIRALSFAIADGALPSNEGRGYVLRRILRRAARFGRTLGLTEPFLYKIVPYLVLAMGDAFPELKQQQNHCELVIKAEEESFNRTLDKGIELFENIASRLIQQQSSVVPGVDAFKLYDTYGFPLDLTQLMAEEKGLTVDLEGFNREMEEQRSRARESGKFVMEEQTRWETVNDQPHSVFRGYEKLECQSNLCLFGEDQDYWHLVFAETPFYGESGGQIGDQGIIRVDGKNYEVADTVRLNDRIVHLIQKTGEFPKNASQFMLAVDRERRKAIACNHTATHLLQAALRQVVGDHVHQAGSLVTQERLRFDFTHFEKVTTEQLNQIENLVNSVIGQALSVCVEHQSYDEAIQAGAMALFGEKYGDQVRVVSVDSFSRELCGGTHVSNTAEIRIFRIISESSVATGVRRIEAVTGRAALDLINNERMVLNEICNRLKTDINQVNQRLINLIDDYNKSQKALRQLSQNDTENQVQELFKAIKVIGDAKYLVARVDNLGMEHLREAIDKLRDKMVTGVALLGSVTDDKVSFVVGVTKNLTGKIQAGAIIKQVAAETGGSGGGRPDLAQAGGKDASKIGQALAVGEQLIKELLSK
ncbi:MAG TPA: alanine--tRNA ligase [Bacillota bacterium]|nr:alanine--tRNA ligase [Bacillota bacterium]HOL09062.1 alanine--tRNA ligase [Bacillota bacterium]HPO96737.1 alanine--tRNA ligase [Bacillota bacterium]